MASSWTRRVLAAAAVAATVAASTATAHAAPGVPEPPAVVFTEDFEHVDTPGVAQSLDTYTGPAPLAATYTAHPAWLNGAACNGVIASFNSGPGATGCREPVFTTYIRGLASSMGTVLGGGNDNEVIGDVTIAGFPAPATPAATLQTVTGIPLPATNRYITFGLDVGVSCAGADPFLRFFLLDGPTAISTNNAAINPCTTPGGTFVNPPGPLTSARVGAFASDKAILMSSSSIGVRLTNDQTSGSGNDYAIDNIRVLDATPALDKAFEPARINPPGHPASTSQLTFTVTNTTDLGEKAGWSFTDFLAPGLTVAGPSGSDCANAVVTAIPGESTITASGDLLTGQASCTVAVEVSAAGPGLYANGPDNVSTVGLDEPGVAQLSVNQPPTAEVSGPSADEDYFVGQDVEADYACHDADGTIASCTGPVPDGGPVDTSTPGTHTFTVTATDDEGATGAKTVIYRVRPVAGLCRGTALRAVGLDPATANAPESPCRTEQRSLVRLNGRIGTATVVGDVLEGSSRSGARTADGEAHVADATITAPGLVIRVQGLRSAASAGIESCRSSATTGASSIATLTINGVDRVALDEPASIPLPGLGAVHLNRTEQSGTTVTQRAVFVDLPGTALDVTIGESRAGIGCGPLPAAGP